MSSVTAYAFLYDKDNRLITVQNGFADVYTLRPGPEVVDHYTLLPGGSIG